MSTSNLSVLSEQELATAVADYRSGMTLPAPLYLDPRYFVHEMKHVLSTNWWLARMSSELPHPGDFAQLQIGAATLLLVRGRDGISRAFYNSCRHRGAKLCNEPHGNLSRITCPYHAWSFGLDGKLLAAPFMPEGFDRGEHPLHPVHVREERGMIFLCLAVGTPPDFDALMAPHRSYLDFVDFTSTRVVLRKRYEVKANWKLAIENLVECYHCASGHGSLCQVEGREQLQVAALGLGSAAGQVLEQKVRPRWDAFEAQIAAGDMPATEAAGWTPETGLFATQRYPLAAGFDTGTMDGQRVMPYLGQSAASAGTGVRMVFSTTTFLQLYSDHAVCLSYLPQTAGTTVVEQTWSVAASAEPDEEAVARIQALWDATTQEDGWLAENQVDGVRQPMYRPGPLSLMEGGTQGFLDWYMSRLAASAVA